MKTSNNTVPSVSLFPHSPVRGVPRTLLANLGPLSSPFKIHSVRGKENIDDGDVMYNRKGQKDVGGGDSRVDILLAKMEAQVVRMGALEAEVVRMGALEAQVVSLQATVDENRFWLCEASTLPLLALYDLVRVFIDALNTKAKELVKLDDSDNGLANEYLQCSKKAKATSLCSYYSFLHGDLATNQVQVQFQNTIKKVETLRVIHNCIEGFSSEIAVRCLSALNRCQITRNMQGHPTLQGDLAVEVIIEKLHSMMENNSLPKEFSESYMQELLRLALNFHKEKLAKKKQHEMINMKQQDVMSTDKRFEPNPGDGQHEADGCDEHRQDNMKQQGVMSTCKTT